MLSFDDFDDVHEIAVKQPLCMAKGMFIGRRLLAKCNEPYQYMLYLKDCLNYHSADPLITDPQKFHEAVNHDLEKLSLELLYFDLDHNPIGYEEACFQPCILLLETNDPFYSAKEH